MFIRNDYPILEFVDNKDAKINPTTWVDKKFKCNKMIITFFPEVMDKLVANGKITLERTIGGENFIYVYRFVDADILITLGVVGCPFCAGNLDLTWTTDAIFRETADRIAQRKADGAKIVEMEQSGCIAVAQYRGFDYGALIYGGDDVSQEEWSNRGWRSREGIRYDLVMLCKELVNVI